MSGLTSLYSKLQNSDATLEERTKLARQILSNNKCFLPNKNQLLVDWICQELSNISRGKKHNGPHSDKQETELWKILSDVLNDPASEEIVLRQKTLPLLFRELEEISRILGNHNFVDDDNLKIRNQDRISCVLLCFRAMLNNPNMSLTFLNKFENLERFSRSMLACFLAVILQKDLHDTKFVDELFHLVVAVLAQYNAAQEQHTVQHKIFTSLCKTLLPLLLFIRTVLKDENFLYYQNLHKDEMSSAIDAVIKSGLFHKDVVSNFTPVATFLQEDEPTPKRPKLVNPYNQFFEVLESFIKNCEHISKVEGIPVTSDLVCETILTSLPYLLENFIETTQENGDVNNASLFSFFVKLYKTTAPKDSVNAKIPDVMRIQLLTRMLNIIFNYDVYQIADDNANDKPIYKWFISLVENELLSDSQCDAVRFNCLDIILKLNHKIIENSLENVLAKCFVKSGEFKEDGKAKIGLLCNVVVTYSKLQQLENLVTSLLKVFTSLGNKVDGVPVDVLTKLSESFEHCPFNQTLSILQVFITAMKEEVNLVEEDGNANLSIEAISILFVNFLSNSTYSAADPHGLDQKKATSLEKCIQKIKHDVIKPLIEAFPTLKTSQEEVGFAILVMARGLNSLIHFLQQHDVIPASDDQSIELLWDSSVGAYIPDESWRGLSVLKNERLRFCMELLVVHKVRCSLLKQNFDCNEFDRMINFLFNFQDLETIPEISSVSWNFDPSCVNSTNYPVAHWSLVAQHAALLIPYCKENQIRNFAKFMVGSLTFEEKKLGEGVITLQQISHGVLQHGELLPFSSLQVAVVEQIWESLGEYMSKVVGDKLSGVFTWEVSEDAEMDDDQEVSERDEASLPSKNIDMNTAILLARMIAEVMNNELHKSKKKHLKKCTTELSMLINLLNVLELLPCHLFTLINQVRCILCSLACDVLMGKFATGDETGSHVQSFVVQLTSRKIVSTLLQSLLQQRAFSTWKIIDVASLLRWVYATSLLQTAYKTCSLTNSKFITTTNKVLASAVMLSLKSHSKAIVSAVSDFNQQLVTSLTQSAKINNQEIIRCVEVLVIVVSACTEFLEQKGKNTSILRTTYSIISCTATCLVSFTKGIFSERESTEQQDEIIVELEKNAMRLCAVLTRAMALIPETEVSEDEKFVNTFEEWSKIVSMLVSKVLGMLEAVMNSSEDALNESTSLVTILKDVFKGGHEYCNSIPNELRNQVLVTCLEILKKCGFPFGGEGIENKTKGDEKSSEIQEAVLGLIESLLEEDVGKNCITVLKGVFDWSTEETNECTSVRLLSGLSVYKRLLATKVVKQSKKELRSVTGRMMITLLTKAPINSEISTVVLETVAALVTIGGGVFNPHDLALVFQALVLNVEARSVFMFSRIFTAKFAILRWTLFYYPDYVYGAVHVFLPCVRELLSSLLIQGAASSQRKLESEERAMFLSCVDKISRLCQEMASHKDVLSKYSIYFLADCVHEMSTRGVPAVLRDVLVQGVYFLFDICNDDGLTKLHVYLPSSERELFRSLKEDYIKHHKFKGNA